MRMSTTCSVVRIVKCKSGYRVVNSWAATTMSFAYEGLSTTKTFIKDASISGRIITSPWLEFRKPSDRQHQQLPPDAGSWLRTNRENGAPEHSPERSTIRLHS